MERVILRCLEKELRSRPASALQVALALPGGDPLAAALAAGETPSPEMVAAAGETEGLRPAIAWSCVALLVAGIVLGFGQKHRRSSSAMSSDDGAIRKSCRATTLDK